MTREELRSLIRKEEGLKLDFKQEYKLQSEPHQGKKKQNQVKREAHLRQYHLYQKRNKKNNV